EFQWLMTPVSSIDTAVCLLYLKRGTFLLFYLSSSQVRSSPIGQSLKVSETWALSCICPPVSVTFGRMVFHSLFLAGSFHEVNIFVEKSAIIFVASTTV